MIPSDQSNQLPQRAETIWKAGIAAVHAGALVENFVSVTDQELVFGDRAIAHQAYQNLIVVGGGKCSAAMVIALEEKWNQHRPTEKKLIGRVNVPDDQVLPSDHIEIVGCRPAGVNLPTPQVVQSTRKIVSMLAESNPDDLIVCLLTGGGSALLELPQPPVKLADLIAVTQLLSLAGASIEQLNSVRRVLSQVKGGGLVRLSNCRRWVTLIVSDIWGDPIDLIASGPTAIPTDGGTKSDLIQQTEAARQVLHSFCSDSNQIPQTVWQLLNENAGLNPSPADQGSSKNLDLTFQPVENHFVEHFVLGNIQTAVEAARKFASGMGYDCQYQYEWESDGSDAPVEKTAKRLVQQLWEQMLRHEAQLPPGQPNQAIQSSPRPAWCLITGGEPTVKIHAEPDTIGRGGRNQHLVLLAIEELITLVNQLGRVPAAEFCLLSAGSDGEDGNTSVAGAYIDSSILRQLLRDDVLKEVRQHLARGDSHRWLRRWGLVFEVPPTGTNVCDLRVLLVNR